MTGKPKKGMAAFLAEQQQQVAAEPAKDAGEELPRPQPTAAARRQRPPRAERPAKASPAAPADRPTARALAAPSRSSVAREALKVDVPADLALLQRLHRRRLDTGMDIRDQVAIAVDEWLTGEGY